jgi:arylsulfate sulfotransferase
VQLVNPLGQVLADTTLIIRTGALPPDMPTSIVASEQTGAALGGEFTLVSNFSATNPQMPLMVDNYGDIRWVLDYRTCPELAGLYYDCGINRLQNGNFYFGDDTTSRLFEVDAYGTIVNRWDLPGYTFHHEVYEKPDGNFLVSVTKKGSTHPDGSPTIEDYVVEVDRHANQLVNVWDLKQSLDETRHALEADPSDWVHVNALLYDPSDHTIIVSGRHQGVAKLTYDNRVVWLLAPHRGWKTNHQGQDLRNYLLAPLDASGQAIADTAVVSGSANHDAFEWNWYQHSIQLMPNGDLLLFDNGTNRNFIRNAPAHYSRAVEYRIDPAARTVRQIWTYGKERGADTYSVIVSRVQYLPAVNHILFCPGYQVPNTTGSGGKIIEVDYATKQPLLQIEMSAANQWGFHRAQRMGLYP